MDELDEDELFTVCLDDDGHPVQRAVRDMTAGEVIAAIDHLTVGSTRIEAREKLARLRQVVAQKHQTELKPSGRCEPYTPCVYRLPTLHALLRPHSVNIATGKQRWRRRLPVWRGGGDTGNQPDQSVIVLPARHAAAFGTSVSVCDRAARCRCWGAVAQLERALIAEPTKPGLRAARSRGRSLGTRTLLQINDTFVNGRL